MNKIKENWHKYVIAILLGMQVLVFAFYREQSYIQVHDNLDLFVPHFQMLKNNNAFFAHGTVLPMIGGLSRDLFGSEFSLYNIFYAIFPSFVAYMIGYALKIVIGMTSMCLLGKDIYGDKYIEYKPIIMVVGLGYGLIPVFPTYGIAFTSVPVIIWLVRRLHIGASLAVNRDRHNVFVRIMLYLGVFCYPLISYFSYHGFFILCYMVCAVIILWIKDKKFPLSTFISICVLAAGYVVFEYRLFSAMLFDDTVTIRSTMVHGDVTVVEALKLAVGEFFRASFHSQDSHTYVILPVVLIGLVIINVLNIRAGKARKCITEPINLVMLVIIFNCLIYGFYEFKPFRDIIETLISKLTGFDFSRTSFFNPVLWYMALAIVCIRLIDSGIKNAKLYAGAIATVAVVAVMLAPQVYNDFYYTCYNQAYKLLLHKETSTLNYEEFYSEEFFEDIKSDMNYEGEWSVAYGLHPAVLVYNGFSTLDGYLGMYSQDYKDKWAAVEAPAFEGSPYFKTYFEEWGARVCLYSGSDENTYDAVRIMELNDKRLMADTDKLKELGCRYIISRVEFDNADEAGVTLYKTYTDSNGPYTIYVYMLE